MRSDSTKLLLSFDYIKSQKALCTDSFGMAVEGIWPRLHGEEETSQLIIFSVEINKARCQAGRNIHMGILTMHTKLTFQSQGVKK